MKKTIAIAVKELKLFFGSPMALIFVGVFLALTLFVFFQVDSFFARGIADVRALFAWMPSLLILLVAALTMSLWSREEDSGNLQMLLTMPVRLIELVAGKFLAALALVAVALALTLFLPFTVASLGALDWGPVIGGYLASLLLAAAYIAIGLCVSSRTDNQLLALIGTVVVCGLLQAIGSPLITDFFGATAGETLRLFGSGSRFESIERGVIDLRDLVYYLSLTVLFLAANVLSLESKRWSGGEHLRQRRWNECICLALIGANLLLFNLLLAPLSAARLDLTEHGDYSLSDVTRQLLGNLDEPLVVRGYFSEASHPLLSPLVPRVKDSLREYELAANGKLQLQFADPLSQPDIEREANQLYGIRPTPLQIDDRGGVSLVNVYFDLLIAYGDQTVSLNFSDLIEISDSPFGIAVRLRNLEYDLTSAIQRVVYGFQSLDAVLASLDQPAQLTLYLTSASLPPAMQEARAVLDEVAADLVADYGDRIAFSSVDLSALDTSIDEAELYDRYQIQPVAVSFFAADTFLLHLVVESGGGAQVVFPAGGINPTAMRGAIEAALKRSAPGFLKVVGLWTPPAQSVDQFGRGMPSLQQYAILEDTLRQTYDLRRLTLEEGVVPAEVDALILIAPHSLSDSQRYAIDQFVMRGGSLFVGAGHYRLGIDPMLGELKLDVNENGIADLLAHYGVTISEGLVMDLQNAPFPMQTQRDLGDMVVTELQALDYPFFVDVRADGIDAENSIVSSLPFLTMDWASPLIVDAELDSTRATTLIRSSSQSWETTDSGIQPELEAYPELGFPIPDQRASFPLAVLIEGSFESAFVDAAPALDMGADEDETPAEPIGSIERSPDDTRLVVIGSSEFVNDNVYQISLNFGGDRFASNLQLVANAIDYFTQDLSLASIRSRGSITRILPPISAAEQNQWTILNYAVALIGLALIGIVWQVARRSEEPIALIPPASDADEPEATEGGA